MIKKTMSMILALAMIFSLMPNPGVSVSAAENTYTYDLPVINAATNWSPMSWISGEDQTIRQLTMTPLVDISIKNSSKGEFQWIYLAAKSITDVTSKVMTDVSSGYVYEIALNPNLCWEDGTSINADTYIYSMQQMLDPDMAYTHAETFCEGSVALAGALDYYRSGQVLIVPNDESNAIDSEDQLVLGEDGNYYDADGNTLYILLNTPLPNWLGGNTLKAYVDAYGNDYFDADAYYELEAMADENGNVVLNPQTLALLQQTISTSAWAEGPEDFIHYIGSETQYPEADWDVVGLEKIDDYTIRYTCANGVDMFTFLRAFQGTNWLIHEELYESCKAAGTYGTSVATTMSYGPYKLKSADTQKQVLVRNEKHYESTTTSFKVDGGYVPQWQMDSVVIYEMPDNEEQKSRFLAGELDIWKIPSDQISTYADSPAMYWTESNTVFSWMLNSNVETLQNMDANFGTTNAVVVSNVNFRKAWSLAMDRKAMGMISSGYRPVLGLITEAYYYDVANNPASIYRKTEEGMQALCDYYGVEYGAGTAYATLEEAYASIDGYDLAQARELMAKACQELVAAGLYTAGEPVVLTYALSAESAFTTKLLAALTDVLNKAAEGSGFGTISVVGTEPLGGMFSYAVRNGEAVMVLGGWSVNALEAFGVMQVYLSETYTFTPKNFDLSEQLTLNLSGTNYTMSWENWAHAVRDGMINGAVFDTDLRLEALATLENAYLKTYSAIPMFGTNNNYMQSYQVSRYTDQYSVMYEFGGLRLMKFNYSDAEWEAYVASGALDYESAEETVVQIAAPTLKASNVASTGKIKLTWNAVDGAAKYKVYRSTDKVNWTRMITTTGTSLTHSSAEAGTLYYYYVIAVDAEGNNSEASKTVSRRCDLPCPVITVSNVASSGKIKISWEPIDGAVKYQVYRSTDKENWTRLITTTGTSLTNSSAEAGKLYYYKVRAIASNSEANSAYSAIKSRRCDLARPVVTLSNIASSGKIKISWKAIEGATKYQVYRSTDNKNWTLLKTVTGTSLTNTSTDAGTLYYYKVKAIASNSEANSAYSSVKSRTCDLPRPVLSVTLNSKGKPSLSWGAVTGAVKYQVYYSTDGETWTRLISTTGTKLTHSSAASGTTYYYKVYAVASVSSANSAYSTVKTITAG